MVNVTQFSFNILLKSEDEDEDESSIGINANEQKVDQYEYNKTRGGWFTAYLYDI